MSRSAYRPRRRLRSEIVPLASVGCLVFAVLGLFPCEVLSGGYAKNARPGKAPIAAGCAFVTLTPAQEAAALAASRTSWQGEHRADSHGVEMMPTELPEVAYAPIIDLAARPPAATRFVASPQICVLPPSEAAAAPMRLPQAKIEPPQPAFSRKTMLEIR